MVDKRRPKGGVKGDGEERTKGSERKSSNRSVGDFSYPKVSFVVFLSVPIEHYSHLDSNQS